MTNDTSEILETLKGQPTKLVDANGHDVDQGQWSPEWWYCAVWRCRANALAFLDATLKDDFDYMLAFEVYDDE